MYNLPSQQKERVEKAITEFKTTGRLNIFEPCNCGAHIQHHNGGNYHCEIYFVKDSGIIFRKDDTTCELGAPAEWHPVSEKQMLEAIEKHADWL